MSAGVGIQVNRGRRLRSASVACMSAVALATSAGSVCAAPPVAPASPASSAPAVRVSAQAEAQVGVTRIYDPAYVRIAYPGGDVPPNRGICADVIVRAYRAGGVDLQRAVHDDMGAHFAAYPRLWGLHAPDANIDHRRVANLMTYFARAGQSRPVTAAPADYRSGDVVAWRLPGGRLHVGMVSDRRSPAGTPLVVHNIGQGAQLQDVLFAWTLIGHYRSFG